MLTLTQICYIIQFMKTININEKNNGKKLNNILQREFPALSLNTIYKALRKKDIRVNDVRIKHR